MESIKLPFKRKKNILALGAESAGVFAIYQKGSIFISKNFGDLLDEDNFLKFKKAVLEYFQKEKKRPDIILTDLHPLYKTTILGEELAKKFKVKHIKIQHHISHIFSTVGDRILLPTTNYQLPTNFIGLAMDGTGYGIDGNVWGGEIFKFKVKSEKLKIVERVGSLEEQIMIGGDAAVKEPARILIAILAKITKHKLQIPNKTQNTNSKIQKDFIYKYVKKYYSRNESEALYNQMEQDFNCQKTTSTGRILDAAAVLLGFAGNERMYKHEATKKLEENSTIPYTDLKPRISFSVIASSPSADGERGNLTDSEINTRLLRRSAPRNDKRWILQTTSLFEYLIKNIHKNKRRLAATAQLYVAKGLYEVIKNHDSKFIIHNSCIFAAGGMTNNKIISEYLEKQGIYLSKKIPRGDEGIAVGQIIYHLANSRH